MCKSASGDGAGIVAAEDCVAICTAGLKKFTQRRTAKIDNGVKERVGECGQLKYDYVSPPHKFT
jgi:hypothetical protein